MGENSDTKRVKEIAFPEKMPGASLSDDAEQSSEDELLYRESMRKRFGVPKALGEPKKGSEIVSPVPGSPESSRSIALYNGSDADESIAQDTDSINTVAAVRGLGVTGP